MVKEKNLKGLRGWLILVDLGLIVAVIFQLVGVYQSVKLFIDGTISVLSDASSTTYIPGFTLWIIYGFIAQIIIIFASLYLLYLFSQKSKKFPKLYIVFLIASLIFILLDYAIWASLSGATSTTQEILKNAQPDLLKSLLRSIVAAIVWGLYMKKSKRVKATFVE